MNQELLRHFREYRPQEKDYLKRLKSGNPYFCDENFVDATQHLKEGRQIALYHEYRFLHNAEHTHNFVEMAYTYAGTSTHIVDGNEIVMQAGELLILNQHATHKEMPLGESDILIYFIILPQFFTKTLSMMGNSESGLNQFLLSCLHNKEQAGGYLHFLVADVMPVQNLLENLIWSLANNVQYSHSVNQFTVGLLFLHLLNHTGKASSGSRRDEVVFKILQYVEERYADGSLAELAALLGYDMTWLSKNIKRLTGSNYENLRQSKRIEQAKFLLRTTPLAVSDIARQVGYGNSGYFYRLFRKQVGCSPETYRKENKTSECAT